MLFLIHVVTLVVYLAAIGSFTYLVTRYVPMSPGIGDAINSAVFLCVLVWVLLILLHQTPWPVLPNFV